MQLKTRYITIKMYLDKGVFPGSEGSNVKIISASSKKNSLTVEASINIVAGLINSTADIKIFGLLPKDINFFSRFNPYYGQNMVANVVEIYAGYELDQSGLPPFCYRGQVYYATVDMNSVDRPFYISAIYGISEQNNIVPAANPAGSIALDDLFKQIIAQMPGNYQYVSNNVNGTANNPHYYGSALNQLKQATTDYGYKFHVDNKTIYVAPLGQSFTDKVFKISAENGLIGYPHGNPYGFSITTYYNPAVRFQQQINLVTELEIANRPDWIINGMSHELQNHGDKWQSTLSLNLTRFVLPS